MAYNYPYMQARPPSGYGAPGTTAYFTTRDLGGFYAPIPHARAYGHVPRPIVASASGAGDGRVFNGWMGVAQEESKSGGDVDRHGAEHKQRSRLRERSPNKTRERPAVSRPATPWEQVVESLNRSRLGRRPGATTHGSETDRDGRDGRHGRDGRDGKGDSDNDNSDDCDDSDDGGARASDNDDDACCSGGEVSSASRSSRSSRSPHSPHSPAADRERVAYNGADSVSEVTIQPGGSAHVVVHLDVADQSPAMTCFTVSARRMHAAATAWYQLCHRGTEAVDTTVTDEAAVLGMFWMLQVLHVPMRDPEPAQDAAASSSHRPTCSYAPGDNGRGAAAHRLRPGLAPATTPCTAPGAQTIPSELPPRVLAYATMFAQQFGVLGSDRQSAAAARTTMTTTTPASPLSSLAAAIGSNGATAVPAVNRFRARAEVWVRSVTSHPRNRRTLDAAVAGPTDWPFLLYVARVLGDRPLFATCLRTLLERWWVNGKGQFCDELGPARLDQLPDLMRQTVIRDLASLKSARERSNESIISGALNAIHFQGTYTQRLG